MPVTLRQLRYFQALVEHGSFSRAAESVHVSQPALSLQVRELEGSLGGPLVERESRGVHLTPLGREAHEQTLRVLDETLLLENMSQRLEAGPLKVAVGIVSTLAPYLLPGIMERLHDSSARIEIDVQEGAGQNLVSRLLAGRLDAAIVSLPLGMLELPERELFEDRLLLAGRAERLAAVRRALGDELHPEELARADLGPLLTLGDGHCLADQVLAACRMWRIQEGSPRRRLARHAVAARGQRRGIDAGSGNGRALRTRRLSRFELSSFRRARTLATDRSHPSRRRAWPTLDRTTGRGRCGRRPGARQGSREGDQGLIRPACRPPEGRAPSVDRRQGGRGAGARGSSIASRQWPSDASDSARDRWISMIVSKPLCSKTTLT